METLHDHGARAPTHRSAFAHPRDVAAWWALGAWIRLTIAGALAVPTGLAILADAAQRGVHAAAMVVAGVALAAFAGWRTARVLAKFETGEAPASAGRNSPAALADPRQGTAAHGGVSA